MEDKYSVIYLEIYPENSNDEEDDPCESPSDPPFPDPTPEHVTARNKPTKELTTEPNYEALSEPSAPTTDVSMGHLSPGDIARYNKELYPSRFSTLEEHTKEDFWGDTWKIPI